MILKAENITLYYGKQKICERLNLTLQKGQCLAILGANGRGKTTLLHTFAGLHSPQSGEVLLDNLSLKNLPPKVVAQSLAVLFQEFATPFPQTVLEYCKVNRYPHLAYFKKENPDDHRIVMQALQDMNLHLLKDRRITHLSGGEKRRLALASVLAQTPHIYLLDEPTNHLDIHYQISALSHFYQLAISGSAGIMMTLHDINLAQRFCTHVLLLFPNGEYVYGPKHELLTAANLASLYQHKINAIDTAHGIYWHPEF